MAEKISIRELARRINVAPNSVVRAKDAEKLTDCFDVVSKTFDWDLAQKNEWVQSASVVKPGRGVSTSKAIEKIDRAENEEKKPRRKKTDPENNKPEEKPNGELPAGESLDDLSEEELADRIKLTDTMSIQQAMKAKEIINAAIDKIKLKQLQGILVPKTDVEKAYYNHAAQLKKALLQLPEIISDDLLGANDKVVLMNILKTSLIGVLEEFSKAPEIIKD